MFASHARRSPSDRHPSAPFLMPKPPNPKGPMTTMSLRMPVVMKERITLKAFSLGLTANEYMRALAEVDMGVENLVPDPEPVVEAEFPISRQFPTGIHPECEHPSARRVGTHCMACHREVGSAL